MKQSFKVKQIAIIGLLGGISAILMYVQFPLPLMPPFMSYDPSSIVEMIGGLMLGPVAAVMIILIKLLVKIVLQGTSSAFTGELQNFLVSCAYVLPAAMIYAKKKTRQQAIQGMMIGTLVCAAVAAVTNLYLIIPFYINLMGLEMDAIIAMCAAVNSHMKDLPTVVIFGVIPFNLIKFGVNSVISALMYKRVSIPIKNMLNER